MIGEYINVIMREGGKWK